jgi:predicted O-methyltransferase YrrM
MYFIDSKIMTYAETFTSPQNAILDALERETHLKTLSPRMLSGHFQGRFLSLISHLMRPKRVLEIGTFTGFSALCMAEGLSDDGLLYALEVDDELAPIIHKYVEQSGFTEKIKVIFGDALEIIPSVDEVFDLVFIDAGKKDYPHYFDMVIGKMRRGGLIIADNVLWSGKILDLKKDKDTEILDSFNKKIQTDSRVENILLPIRDGLMMARVI